MGEEIDAHTKDNFFYRSALQIFFLWEGIKNISLFSLNAKNTYSRQFSTVEENKN